MRSRALVATAAISACMLCGTVVAGVGASASASDVYVTVADVNVSDDEPTVGDAVTITPTIRHSSSAAGGFHVAEVELHAPGEGAVERVRDVGSLAPGETLAVPLRTTASEAGEQTYTVRVRGLTEAADGPGRVGVVDRPVYLSVAEPSSGPIEPRALIDADSAVAGDTTSATVTVSNGEDEALTDLAVRLDSVEDTVGSQTRVTPSLPAGNKTTFEFDVRPGEAVETTLKATVRADGDVVAKAFEPVAVASVREDVAVYASVLDGNDTTSLQYRVTNRGNAPVDEVAVSASTDDGDLPGASLPTVDPGETESVTVPVASPPAGAADVVATYTTAGRAGESARTVSLAGAGDQPGGFPIVGASLALLGLLGASTVGYRFRRR